MKREILKISLFIFSTFLISTILAQNISSPDGNKSTKDVIFYEDFSDNGIENWTPDGDGTGNWEEIPTTFTGGEAPELVMNGYPNFTGTARFISPVINTSDYTTLNLSFLHHVISNEGGFWLSVETTSDGGTTWNEAWMVSWETGTVTEAISTDVSTSDVGSEDFQFCFKFEENSSLLGGWMIDNITLGDSQVLNDVTPTSLSGLEGGIYENDEVLISAMIYNNGAETVSFDVLLEISDGSSVVFESTKSISDLASGEEQQVDFDSWTAIEGFNYTATVTSLLVGDENTANDVLDQLFNVYPEGYYCLPGANCSYGDGLTDFAFAGIENYDNGCSNNGYGAFPELTANIIAGETYVATMATGWDFQNVSIWVDFNLDLEFTSDELILTDFVFDEASGFTDVDVTIPVDVQTATTTMRIGVNYNDISSPDPCATFTYGEWEDYSIEVTEISGTNEATFHVTEPDGANYEGAIINFYAQTGTTNNQGLYTFTGIAEGTFPYTVIIEDGYYYNHEGEVDVNNPNTTVEVELLLNTNVDRNFVIIEEWTATWCYTCPAAANGIEELYEAGYDIGVVAYHNADAYSTGNDVRMFNFYNRSWLPSVAFDGTFAAECNGSATESCFEFFEPIVLEQMQKTSPYDISFTSVDLNNSDLSATVKVSYPGFTYSEDVRLLVAITESDIPEQWEGMEYVHFVERGMYPDFNGTVIELEMNDELEMDVNFTIDPSWVTGYMEIIAFVQDFETKEIYNGVKSPILDVDIEDYSTFNQVKIFPNPANDKVYIEAIGNSERVQLLNISGQLVFDQAISGNKFEINTSKFDSGIYFIKVFSHDNVITRKLVIE